MGWRPKNMNDSLVPLSTLFAFFGFCTFQYPLGQPRVLFSVIYTIIITSLYYVLFAYTVKHSLESSWFKLEELTFFCIIIINNVIAGLAQILSWYHMKTRSRAMNKLTKVDETLKDLDATLDYMKFMYNGIAIIVCWLLIIIITNTIDMFWFTNDVPVIEAVIVITVLHHAVHMNAIVALEFTLVLRFLEVRFSKANKLLEETLKFVHQRPFNVHCWFSRNKVNEADSLCISKHKNSRTPEDRKSLVQVIKHVHLELVEIAYDVDCSYGVQILLVIAAYFVTYTGLLYNLYTTIVNPSTDRVYMRSIIIITWVVMDSSKLMAINYLCERVTAEAKKTAELTHCIDSSEDSECPDEISQFSLQLMHNPLSFSPAGFFTLGFRFVRGFYSSVVTYLVILIEMSGLPTKF